VVAPPSLAIGGFLITGGSAIAVPIVLLVGFLIGSAHWRGYELGRRLGRRKDW
jgi:hypothetical protein